MIGAPERPGRLPGFDVVRAVALIGVVVMNYHGYLNGGSGPDPSWAERVFDPFMGVLSTRFAATFVTIAGVGTVLLTNRSRLSGDRGARSDDRWKLVRRGVLLLGYGYVLDWIWQGTILFYYGALFMIAALLFTLRIRWLVVIGSLSAAAGWAVQAWILQRELDGSDPWWLERGGRWSYDSASMRSPRELVLDVFVHGTHPLFPWLAFFCCGMVIGRLVPHLRTWRRPLLLTGTAMVALGYAAATALRIATEDATGDLGAHLAALARTDPFSRQPLYVVTTVGSSVVAVLGIAWLADRFAGSATVDLLRRAGQLTLSLYTLHVLVFRGMVDTLGWVRPTGLDTALTFAVAFWAFAIALGAWWHRYVGMGPLERCYRRFGG